MGEELQRCYEDLITWYDRYDRSSRSDQNGMGIARRMCALELILKVDWHNGSLSESRAVTVKSVVDSASLLDSAWKSGRLRIRPGNVSLMVHNDCHAYFFVRNMDPSL